MRSFVTVVLAGILGLSLAGCDPFETEITINPDGSGKMVQHGQLSPAAFMVCRDMMVVDGARGGRIQLLCTDEAAKAWSEAHADGPVKLASFSCKRDDKGWRTISCEVTFSNLEHLAATEWGWPLGLSASAKDGKTELRFSDPARRGFEPMVQREMMGGDNDEIAELLQVGPSLTAGMRTRVTWKLPVEALGATGAQLSGDKKTVTYEATVGEGAEKFRAWWEDKTALILFLPADSPVKPFTQPPAPVVPLNPMAERPAPKPAGPAAPPADAKDFEFRLSSVSLTRSFGYDAHHRGVQPSKNDRVDITFTLFGPERAEIRRTAPGINRPGQPPPDDLLSALKDGDGKDLRGPDSGMNFFVNKMDWKNADEDKVQFGRMNLSCKPPPGGSKVLALVEGYVVADRTTEMGKLEVKPLKDNLEKDFVLPMGVIRFNSITGNQINCVFTAKDDMTYCPMGDSIVVKCFSAEGAELAPHGTRARGNFKKWDTTVTIGQPLPDGAYAVVTYPAKVEKVKLPFKAENIQLP